jgi:hypothetical protein
LDTGPTVGGFIAQFHSPSGHQIQGVKGTRACFSE